jgi:stage II sporulation protein E
MTQLMTYVEIKGVHQEIPVPEGWRQYCVRPEQVVKGLQHQYAYHEQTMYWKEKISESRRMVTEQLTGLAEVMEKLAGEIRRESKVMTAQEEQIYQALEEMGIAVDRVDLYSLEEGKVEIEITLPHPDSLDECKKLIAPMLSELIGEPIDVYRKVIREGSNRAVIALGSAQKFSCKTGVASKAKGGSYISGDSYCYMNLGVGKYAVALSDGMGNGARAQEESSAALKLLRRLLLAGMNEERAIETINSLLSLRSSDEVFATMDLAMVDLNTADGRFMKIGSHPSFIKRGRKVIQLSSGNPPIGILNQIEVEPIEVKLQPGDLLVMMTDGVYDLGKSYANKESAVIRMIQEIDSKDPQDFASQLLEKAIRSRKGKIDDDMTVIVTKVERHAPEWSTIRLPGLSPLNARSEKWV